MDTAGDGKVGVHIAIENRNPMQPQQQLFRPAQCELGADIEVLQIEVRLIKTVEQDQPIGAGMIEFHGQMRNAGVLRRELDRNRNSSGRLDLPHQLDKFLFYGCAAFRQAPLPANRC